LESFNISFQSVDDVLQQLTENEFPFMPCDEFLESPNSDIPTVLVMESINVAGNLTSDTTQRPHHHQQKIGSEGTRRS
jgi:hypothetical protein